ncbi:MAG: sulfite exporter TauE/SafE family protein [Cognatishimia sp.]
MDPQNLILVAMAFALGGILKGATGAGAPLLAVPMLATLFDVQFAVAVFVLPNLVPNLWQAWHYRRVEISRVFVMKFALAGGLGAAIGTYALAKTSSQTLIAGVAVILLVYITFRLLKPVWQVPFSIADRVSIPLGTLAGILQGATGLSAPVSITFLNAINFDRPQFILAISTFFFTLGLVQLPLQVALGIMTWDRLGLSALALIPLLCAMPIGMAIGRRLSRRAFDTLLLCLLGALALRMLSSVFLAI